MGREVHSVETAFPSCHVSSSLVSDANVCVKSARSCVYTCRSVCVLSLIQLHILTADSVNTPLYELCGLNELCMNKNIGTFMDVVIRHQIILQIRHQIIFGTLWSFGGNLTSTQIQDNKNNFGTFVSALSNFSRERSMSKNKEKISRK